MRILRRLQIRGTEKSSSGQAGSARRSCEDCKFAAPKTPVQDRLKNEYDCEIEECHFFVQAIKN
ncbi:hypothetical protein X777_05409 [Ooceraea biroi]|uniref:Uncharacterized protein n=1 Tax=Ooceraea biroi TaxID=2015173 RepID=A0A026WGT8_OOCBI|nr:hypothetical protein X777_05409 [Ooceraea biroi]